MAETQTASSPVETPDPFNGQVPSLEEFNEYRTTGEVPQRFKPVEAESTPADAPEQTATSENAPETEPEDNQEQPRKVPEAEKRIKQLLSEVKELKGRLAAKPDEKPAPSAAPQAQQIAPTRPEPTLNDTKEDGTPKYADYASFIKDLGAWSAEQTIHASRQRDIEQQQTRKIKEGIDEARRRYGDEFDSVIEPTAGAIMGNAAIPLAVKQMIAGSDVLPELVYTIGTGEKTMKELERLAKSNPTQAMRYIATVEAGIRSEMEAAPKETPAPEPTKTAAPKPPTPVTGPSSRAFDVSDESLSADDWMRKRNAQVLRRG